MKSWDRILIWLYPYLAHALGLGLLTGFIFLYYDFTKPLPDPIKIIDAQLAERAPLTTASEIINIETDQSAVVSVPIVSETTALVNINTADQATLESLPKIGPVTAGKIMEYRQNKAFQSIEEIMEVTGIGTKTFEQIRELITI